MNLGLFEKKNCWCLTWTGRALVVVFLVAAGYVLLHTIYGFLAQNTPLRSSIVVVEGHVPDYVLDSTIVVFRKQAGRLLFTTGIPISHGSYLGSFQNYADLSRSSLLALGMDSSLVVSAPGQPQQKDRTFMSALALKAKLQQCGILGGRLDLVTCGSHARRSRMMYQKALGPAYQVGVYSFSDQDFDPQQWWRSSYGMRAVVYEGLAYLYAAFFFHPENGMED
jgi:hypothetical protein